MLQVGKSIQSLNVVAALPCTVCSGQLSEVLNLVPWGGVSLQFRHLRLFGMQGVAGVGEWNGVACASVCAIAWNRCPVLHSGW